jgi:hypothetical protein
MSGSRGSGGVLGTVANSDVASRASRSMTEQPRRRHERRAPGRHRLGHRVGARGAGSRRAPSSPSSSPRPTTASTSAPMSSTSLSHCSTTFKRRPPGRPPTTAGASSTRPSSRSATSTATPSVPTPCSLRRPRHRRPNDAPTRSRHAPRPIPAIDPQTHESRQGTGGLRTRPEDQRCPAHHHPFGRGSSKAAMVEVMGFGIPPGHSGRCEQPCEQPAGFRIW